MGGSGLGGDQAAIPWRNGWRENSWRRSGGENLGVKAKMVAKVAKRKSA